jgi:SAM-dependent methyltransferase
MGDDHESRNLPLGEFPYRDEQAACTEAIWPVVKAMMPAAPCRVLEVGSGNGAFAVDLVGLGYEVTGLDTSQSGTTIAKTREPRATFHCWSVYDRPPDDWVGCFDVVVSIETIEHLQFPAVLVARAREALRPGGTLIISTPYHGYLKNLALGLTGRWDRHFTTLWDQGHVKFFSKKTLGDLLRREGFEGVRFRGCGRVPWLWMSMVAVCGKPA